MVTLTEEQTTLLILIGRPDEGTVNEVDVNAERITTELVDLGLVDYAGMNFLGKECYDLTSEGERVYADLTD